MTIELPQPTDSPKEQERKLKALARELGDEALFNFSRYLRDNKNTAVARFQERQAATLLRREMAKNPTLDFDQARRQLAKRLGYDALTRTNLYKLIDAGLIALNNEDAKKSQRKLASVG